MTGDLHQRTAEFYERLNTVAAAAWYLKLFERDVEVQIDNLPPLVMRVRDGRLSVQPGAASAPQRSVLKVDGETWSDILAARIGFAQAGGGMGGRLRCMGGLGSFMHMSWLGILTRLAQENR